MLSRVVTWRQRGLRVAPPGRCTLSTFEQLARAVCVLTALGLAGCVGAVVEVIPPSQSPADLVVTNARVVTMLAIRPEAQAFAVTDGRFRVLGSHEQVSPFIGEETRVVDAKGAVILPGLIDAHLHLFGEGYRLMGLDLVGTKSKAEVLERVAAAASEPVAGAWLRGRGWDQNDWEDTNFPTAADLDAVVSTRPVVLSRIDGHAIWVNTAALVQAGINAETADPEGGRILRDESGEATGVLIDAAGSLVWSVVPDHSRAEKTEAVKRAAAACVAAGLTGIHEPGIGEEELEILKELYRRKELPLRIYVMLTPGPALDRYLEAGPEVGLFGHRLTVRAVKLYVDGALGSRGARLLEDYTDESGNRGLLITSEAELEKMVEKIAYSRFQPCVHAIGDGANRMVLDVFERALKAESRQKLRPRIEHAQVVSQEDLSRFGRLGVIASMQPTHATSDMPWAEERLGPERVKGAYAWRSLQRGGARIAFGSDAPVESVKPLWGLYAATTRMDLEGNPEGGWYPEETLRIDDAISAYTEGSAYAAFEEGTKGAIAPGRLADFVMLDRDPRKVPPSEIPNLRVLATYVGGEMVYSAEEGN